MEKRKEICERWVGLIREKAFEYEVPQRKAGKGNDVSHPDLLDIANEVEAFFVGLIND